MRKITIYIMAAIIALAMTAGFASCGTGRAAVRNNSSYRPASDSIPLASDDPIRNYIDSLVAPPATAPDTIADTASGLPEPVAMPDSLLAAAADSLPADTTASAPKKSRIVRQKVDLDAAVEFSAKDSMIVIRRDSAMMFGQSSVSYGDIKLDADNIDMDLRNNTVFAVGTTDSLGDVTGKPIFNESGTDYEAATMRYNFISERHSGSRG